MHTSNPELPADLVQLYKYRFIPSHFPPFSIQRPKQTPAREWWTESRRPLTDKKLAAHLEGRYHIGVRYPVHTRTVVADLDIKEGSNSLADHDRLDRLTDAVCGAVDATPLIFTTPRGGRHIHWPTATAVFSKAGGDFLRDTLRAAGVPLGPGMVEVFPDGKKALRAPLAASCYMLDRHSLLPISADRPSNLHCLRDILANDQFDALEIPQNYCTDDDLIGQPPTLPTDRVCGDISEFGGEIAQLLAYGLTAPSTANDALLKLNWYFHIGLALPSAQVEAELGAWIRQHHNGFVPQLPTNPAAVDRHIRGIVKCWDPSKVKPRKHTPRKSKPTTSPTERAVAQADRYDLEPKVRDFYVSLLKYVFLKDEGSGRKVVGDGWIEADIPSRTLKNWRFRYAPILRKLQDLGLVLKVRNYSTHGQCIRYRIINCTT